MDREKITGQCYEGEEIDAASMPHPMFSTHHTYIATSPDSIHLE